jgi:hypothetical protein
VTDALLLWISLFGVWPVADPGHEWDTLGSRIDLLVHMVGWVGLGLRWRVVRR